MSDHEPGQSVRVRCDVEGFVFADSHERTAGYVSHRVAARLARRDSDRRESTHDGWRVFDMNEVQLEILASRNVPDAIGVLFRQIGHAFELLWSHPAVRNLNPLHAGSVPHRVRSLGDFLGKREGLRLGAVMTLAVVISLAVDAPPQTCFSKYFFVEFYLGCEARFPFRRCQSLPQAAMKSCRLNAISRVRGWPSSMSPVVIELTPNRTKWSLCNDESTYQLRRYIRKPVNLPEWHWSNN